MSEPTAPCRTPADQQALHFHLSTLQNIVARMASNSFAVRNWSVTFVGGTVALLAQHGQDRAALLLLPAALLFAWLDAYYIVAERDFRDQYNTDVAALQAGTLDHAILYLVRRPACTYRKVFCALATVAVAPMLGCNLGLIGLAAIFL